jgi:hypothetical protein
MHPVAKLRVLLRNIHMAICHFVVNELGIPFFPSLWCCYLLWFLPPLSHLKPQTASLSACSWVILHILPCSNSLYFWQMWPTHLPKDPEDCKAGSLPCLDQYPTHLATRWLKSTCWGVWTLRPILVNLDNISGVKLVFLPSLIQSNSVRCSRIQFCSKLAG